MCASAIAACSGKANDGMPTDPARSSSGTPRALMNAVMTGIVRSSDPTASAMCRATSGACDAIGGM